MLELYEQYKGLLFHLAYQMTGTVSDAEDAVQDVFVRVQSLPLGQLEEPKAYLCKMVTNRCLDEIKSARKRREQYYGPWLPEPIPASYSESFEAVENHELLSYAMLVLLERLSPSERAVFVLREALGFDYSEIAGLINKTESNCRKLMSRARGKMGITEDDLIGVGSMAEEWVSRFFTALSEGDAEHVLTLLADDAVLLSDGGGKVIAAARPVESKERVARFLIGILHQAQLEDGEAPEIEVRELNHQTAVIFRQVGSVTGVIFVNIRNGLLQNIYIVRNPDKLAGI
ncbi:RNA polymerase sigma factor SigJ [Paenibacillus lautus]|uniref:RNA polymerase sigma factor SigJ n=1 Tax=Paenibacillus lautus TaxID=1401 RepID=UPI002DB938CE|nr:RNA polymerase sigma factor SigJ [Paenibacillus lautus]MEC0256461.1 RNA polymerase sigma factor SigJ [Paenibacillus lautus]